ncbi:DUF1858 domain-containing protein [Tropicibacter oceani]|uniref:DUF1858 domain-containing protein n=1 Tax=Tropicibacter oceani TaxID=3058420 RepID=A0ABY8QNJ9_9RHOB|nr:DUF1858 domain-containing protein [Tropicibacter oceani]WGW05616.1 DUF1858 domain-containing protein [Tropicibacter oceani]
MNRPCIDDPGLSLSQVMASWPQTVAVFVRHRMLCVGCMVTPFHTITDACLEYDLDEDSFRDSLRQAIAAAPDQGCASTTSA